MLVSICHCDFCQKRTGSVFQVSAYFATEGLNAEISGETKIYNGLEIDDVGAASGDAISYHFCTTCGSTVYWTLDARARLAIAADPAFPAPTREYFAKLRHSWVTTPVPDVDQFEAFPTQ